VPVITEVYGFKAKDTAKALEVGDDGSLGFGDTDGQAALRTDPRSSR
jgi:hypothetical protein